MKNDHRVLKNKSLQIWDHKPIVRLTFLGQGWRYDVLLFEKLFFLIKLDFGTDFQLENTFNGSFLESLRRANGKLWVLSDGASHR